MRAKQLAEFLLKNPEAEVVFEYYCGFSTFASVDSAEYHQKGIALECFKNSNTGAVSKTGITTTPVILIGVK